MMSRCSTLALAVALLLTSACGLEDATITSVGPEGLTIERYPALRADIGPQESDAAWQRIDWMPSYREGLEAAAQEQKPILLWVMNGHPLGCT
jgi:hypothetical protein